MDNKLLLKYGMRGKKEDIFHSSTFGKAQNTSGMGTASSMSFSQRMKIDNNRSMVRGYRDSKIMSEAKERGPKAEQYSASRDKFLNGSQKAGAGDGGSSRFGGNQSGGVGSFRPSSQPIRSSNNQFGRPGQ